jgi:hypothetical protein
MSFIYAVFVGAAVGFSDLSIVLSIVLIIVSVSLRPIKDILFKNDFITGTLSPYQLYLMNLNKINKIESSPALKYYGLSILVDGAIAIIVFIIMKFIN